MGSSVPDWRERRRRREMKKKMTVIALLVAIVVLIVLIVVFVIIRWKKQDVPPQEKDTQNTQVASEIADTQEDTQEPEDEENQPILSPDPSLYTGELPFQWKMNNVQYDDLAHIDTEVLSWGLGPSRDSMNRPYDALNYQQKYGKYQSYFIRDDVTDKIVYLTFDEGYEYGLTPSILDTLKEKDVKAVFFVTLPFVKENPDLVQRMIDEGHIVGNHTVTHPSNGLQSLSLEEQANEVTTLHEYVKEHFQYEMWLFRYPTGKFNEQSIALVNNLGYASLFWTFAYLDYDVNNQPPEEEALQKMQDKICPGSIMLLHGESETNANVLGRFIDWGREQGYTFSLFYPVSQEEEAAAQEE